MSIPLRINQNITASETPDFPFVEESVRISALRLRKTPRRNDYTSTMRFEENNEWDHDERDHLPDLKS